VVVAASPPSLDSTLGRLVAAGSVLGVSVLTSLLFAAAGAKDVGQRNACGRSSEFFEPCCAAKLCSAGIICTILFSTCLSICI